MGRRHLYLLLTPLVVAVQIGGFVTLRDLYLAGFGPDRSLADAAHVPTAQTWLLVFGVTGSATALVAIYTHLGRARWALAVPLVTLVHVPALLSALASLYVWAGCRGFV
jgi:hypothetical protein